MSLCYYIPGLRSVQKAREGHDGDIEKAGLLHAFPGELCAQVHCDGPDGGNGCVVAIKSNGCGYYPKRQTWTVAPGGKWWIGVEGETLPKDLEREEVIDGHLVELEDGNDWLIPAARVFGRGIVLPRVVTLGPNGEKVREPIARFAELSMAAERVSDEVYTPEDEMDAEAVRISEDEAENMAICAIATNYRVSAIEVYLLRIVTTANVPAILRALVDWPTYVEAARRAEGNVESTPESSSTADGGSD